MSAADAALVARVPALLEALRHLDGNADRKTEPTLRELLNVFLDGEEHEPMHPAAVDALLDGGLISHLLARCAVATPGGWPLAALRRANFISASARDSVGLAGCIQLLNFAERDAALAPSSSTILKNVTNSASLATNVRSEAGLVTLRRLFSFCDRFLSKRSLLLLGNVLHDASAAERQTVSEFITVAWLEKHLRRSIISHAPDLAVARGVLYICYFFLMEPGFEEAMRPLYHYFAIALSLLSTLPSSKDLIDMAEDAALCLCLVNSAPDEETPSQVVVALMHLQPGALASMAVLAVTRSPGLTVENVQFIARRLMRVFCAPPAVVEVTFRSLMDSFFTLPALCSVPYLLSEAEDAARLLNICTTRTALHFLTQPLPHHRVSVAASLAHLATLDERFAKHLADNQHLETLLDAVFEAATSSDDAASIMPGGCCREWHTNSLLTAVAEAAEACRISAPAEEEEESRRKRPRSFLDASDVGVQHRDSTTFLIVSQPFHVHSIAMEKVSPVLKQAMEAAGSSREPIALPLALDAPADRHHALFGLAVEFAYTGAISRLSDNDALPLYTLAEFLQIDALRSYVLDTRLPHLMHADSEFAERVWAAAMTFPALQMMAAEAILDRLSRPDAAADDVRSLLRRCYIASVAQPEPTPESSEFEPRVPWIVHIFAQAMRSFMRARVAAAAGGAG